MFLDRLNGIKEFAGKKAHFQNMFEDFVFNRFRYVFSPSDETHPQRANQIINYFASVFPFLFMSSEKKSSWSERFSEF
jgi:hypothetical protein